MLEVSLCFIYFEAMLLGAHKFRGVISWEIGALVVNYELTLVNSSRVISLRSICLILTQRPQLPLGWHLHGASPLLL